jgi:hypothetical protein
MEGNQVFLGEFKGMFFTLQNIPLDSSGNYPMDYTHHIQIYKGLLDDAQYHEQYEPEKYRNLKSHLYTNVPKIQVHPSGNALFTDKRTYNFTHLLLIEPKVIRTFDVNGKTYGELQSKAYGVTEKFPLTKNDDSQNGQSEIPDKVDETYNQSQGGGGGNDSSSSDNGEWIRKNGCLWSVFTFLWTRLWSILGWILLIWFLISLLRSCNGMDDYCSELEELKRKELVEKHRLDSIKVEYEKNLTLALQGISKIYFYRGESNFHVNSIGDNSPINRLVALMQAYKEKSFEIEGYIDGMSEKNGLDSLRALRMRDTLVTLGIDINRLKCTPKGKSKGLKLDKQYISKGYYKQYNRNMRIEIKSK